MSINSSPTGVVTFVNSLEPDQARQKVGPDLYSNGLTPKRSERILKNVLKIIDRRQKAPDNTKFFSYNCSLYFCGNQFLYVIIF